MNRMHAFSGALAVAIVASLPGCGGNDKAPESPSNTVEPAPATPAPQTPPPTASTDTATVTPPAPAAPAPAGLSDSEILAIAQTAHAGEIDEAKFIEGRTKNAKIKAFAKMMQKHHGDAREQGDKLAKKLNLVPQENATTSDMKGKAKNEIAGLEGKNGNDLDRAYIDNQVKGHEDVLRTIDEKLLPNAKSPELKQMLSDFRPTVAAHLEEAKKIQATLPSK